MPPTLPPWPPCPLVLQCVLWPEPAELVPTALTPRLEPWACERGKGGDIVWVRCQHCVTKILDVQEKEKEREAPSLRTDCL